MWIRAKCTQFNMCRITQLVLPCACFNPSSKLPNRVTLPNMFLTRIGVLTWQAVSDAVLRARSGLAARNRGSNFLFLARNDSH